MALNSKSIGKMQGDNLIKLKYLKKAEVSSRVLSFNMASRTEMARNIRWSFREQRLNVEKVRKRQTMIYKDLVRLQQNKRRMLRETHIYKKEDNQLEALRAEREERINKVMSDYDEQTREMLDDIMSSDRKRKRKQSLESTESHNSNSEKPQVVLASAMPENESNEVLATPSESIELTSLGEEPTPSQFVAQTEKLVRQNALECEPRKPEEIRRTIKTLEVSTREPKTVVKTQSQNDIFWKKQGSIQTAPKNTDTLERVGSGQIVSMPPISQSSDVRLIVEVKRINSKPRRQSRSPNRHSLRLPSIQENEDSLILQENENVAKNSSDVGQKSSRHLYDSMSTSSSSSSVKHAKISNRDYIKRLHERREAENLKILDSPYQTYTENEKGQIVPMISNPKPFPRELPTNRSKYEKHKMLEKQYKQNAMQGLKLKGFFAKLQKPKDK